MLAAAIVGTVALLFLLAFLAPRLSRRPQDPVERVLAKGQGEGATAPGPIGSLPGKSFGKSRKATDKSAEAGRKSRGKVPF